MEKQFKDLIEAARKYAALTEEVYRKVDIITEFNDGSEYRGNDVQTALVCGFTAQSRGGVKRHIVMWDSVSPLVLAAPDMVNFLLKVAEILEQVGGTRDA